MSVTDRVWRKRPTDVSNLFNPAFLSMIVRRAIDGYENETDEGLPYELAFIVLPLVLHEATRAKLPSISTTMQTWIQENRDVVIGFARRAEEMVPLGREAIMFGVQRDVIHFEHLGGLIAGPSKLVKVSPYKNLSDEIKRIYSKSEFLGRWLAQQSSSTTVFAMLGIRP